MKQRQDSEIFSTDLIYKKTGRIQSNIWPDFYIFGRIAPSSRILDIGCGSGKLSLYLASMGHTVYGIDHDMHQIEQAHELANSIDNCNFLYGSAASLPFPNDYFDVVILEAVLSTVIVAEDRERILKGANRVIHEGGFVYISEFAQNWQIPLYHERYERDFHITNEIGLFIVRDQNNQELFRAKHFSRREIVDLMVKSNLILESLRTIPLKTFTGNEVDGFQVIAKKPANSSIF